jgi:glycerol-3-phosphate dehydrogenase (NAD(P)+)
MNVAVLGAGAWGTALARLLAGGKNSVTLWGHDAGRLAEIQRTNRNEHYLPGVQLPGGLRYESELAAAIREAELIVVAVPSKAFREVTEGLEKFSGVVVSVTKGIEHQTGLTMCGVLAQTAPKAKCAALSGPSFALEVARGVPTAIVTASDDPATATVVQQLFHRPAFRVYTSTDLLGVELGGALKNVIAIAAGVCDGLGFGDNSKAALVTRAIAELRRLGVACGAQTETFAGLSGIGDLMVTCFSRLSRNRGFGERVGKGEKIDAIVNSMTAVAEGFPTARSARHLARSRGVETPIIEEVYAMLYEGKNIRQAVQDLTTRESKAED